MPARPTRPVPSSPRVPGSGVTNTSLLPCHPPFFESLKTPAIVFPPVEIPWMVMLLPLTVAEPLLNVPLNRLTLLPFQTLTVPPAMLKQPAPHEVLPKLTEIVTVPAPKAPPFTANWLKETDRLPPLLTLPTTVAGLVEPA